MMIQSGERSILPFGVAEIDCAGFCRDRLKKDIFVKSKTHVIGRKRLSAVRNGGWVLLPGDRGFICGHFSGKNLTRCGGNSRLFLASEIPNWRISGRDQGIEVSQWDCGESSYGFFGSGSKKQNFHPSSARGASGTRPCLLGNFWIEARVTRGGRTHQRDAPFVSGPTTHE